MKKNKRILALLLSLIFCLAAFSPAALAAGDADVAVDETPMPRAMLGISVNLTHTFVSARGTSTDHSEFLTIQFWLYDEKGIYVTSGSGSGYLEAIASDTISIDAGTYRLVGTVTGSISGSKTHAFYLDLV
jgi:hypothetical protein